MRLNYISHLEEITRLKLKNKILKGLLKKKELFFFNTHLERLRKQDKKRVQKVISKGGVIEVQSLNLNEVLEIIKEYDAVVRNEEFKYGGYHVTLEFGVFTFIVQCSMLRTNLIRIGRI